MKQFDPRLYFITDRTGLDEEEFLRRVEAALEGGVTMVQIREKETNTRDYLALAQKVHALTRRYGVPMIVDDRLDVALAADAEGVHLGQSDLPVETARALLGPDRIIGATAKTVDQAREAWRQGADYLGVGAIYPTTTKVKTVLTAPETLWEICGAVPIPVNAIGGLHRDNLDILEGIPVAGICVVSAIMRADDPKGAAQALMHRVQELNL